LVVAVSMISDLAQVAANEAFGNAISSVFGQARSLQLSPEEGVLAGIELLLKIQLHRISIKGNSQMKSRDIDRGSQDKRGLREGEERRFRSH
jgi:hypothetical protein